MTLMIRLMGPVEVEADGRPLRVDTKKAVALLAYLATSQGPRDRGHLADLLWPDHEENRARATLRRTLSALRSGLGDGWIEVDGDHVGLATTGVDLDIARLDALEDLHDHPDNESCDGCVAALEGMVELHRGDFMQGFTLKDARGFEEWQLVENERMRRILGLAFDRLIDAYAATGRDDDALTAAARRIELDPLNEPTYRSIMKIRARKGERGAVVAAYRALVATLERELGVEPLEETTALYRALSRGAAETVPSGRPAPETEGEPLPFVGRSREWERLVTSYGTGTPHVIGIEGEPGIGKTRLVDEFLEHVSSLGARTLVARSHEGESNVAYGVLTEALRGLVTSRVAARLSESAVEELGRLLPELDVPAAPQPVAGRFYEAVRSAFEEGLRGQNTGVIVFEDVHWSDDASLEVLAYIARRISETGIWLVCTWRSQEVDDPDPLGRVVDPSSALLLHLARLGRADLVALLRETEGGDGDLEATADRLLAETEGVPFFVTEYVKSLMTRNTWDVPSTVRDLVLRRLGTVRGVAAQVLGAAAVIDRTVEFEMVCRVSGRTDLETVDALEVLARTGMMLAVDETDRVRYEFSHEKLRAVAYETMGPARRHVLHRRAAEALIGSTSPSERDATAAAIARHLELAGDAERAAEYHRRAGIWAHGVFAHAQALEHLQKALALGDVTSEIHEAIADVHVVRGNYSDAIRSYETAAALAARPEVIDRKLGALYLRRGEYGLAETHLTDALDSSDDETLTIELLVDLSLTARRRGLDDAAADLAADAVARAGALGDPALGARAENAAGLVASARGRDEEARAHLQVAFDMGTVADDLPAMIAALNNLALLERRNGDIAEAIELTERALEACRRSGDRHREAALENNLADLFHDDGNAERAMEHLKRATAIFAEVGTDPQGPLPEVWKLVDW